MTKREQADEILISAFEAHLSEVNHARFPKPYDRIFVALAKVEDEVVALAYEKQINPRTLRSAFKRLRERVRS